MSLDSKTLEDILITKSLGMLSPEARILLTDYLERNPEAVPLSQLYDDVIHLAKQTTGSNAPVTLPAFPAKVLRQSANRQHWLFWIKKGSAIAAALVVGFLLSVPFWKSPASVRPIVSEEPAVVERSIVRPEPERENSFWSIKLSSLHDNGPRKHKTVGLIWKSFSQKPEIGGDL